jgi:hypothetical protein
MGFATESTPAQLMVALPEAGAVQLTTVVVGLPLVKIGLPSVPASAETVSEVTEEKVIPFFVVLQVIATVAPALMPEQVPGTEAQSAPATVSDGLLQAACAAGA